MSQEFLKDRRQALEESFFAKENEKAVEKLRAAQAEKMTREALEAATGITNDATLDRLIELGFTAETLAALSLYPLIAVAWADRSVDKAERRAVLEAAHEHGIARGEPCHDLLESWLEHRPSAGMLEAWKSLVAGLKDHVDEGALDTLAKSLVERAHGVAKASGGVLGIGKVSEAEKQVLAELEQAFG
jgi:hypothetical protein